MLQPFTLRAGGSGNNSRRINVREQNSLKLHEGSEKVKNGYLFVGFNLKAFQNAEKLHVVKAKINFKCKITFLILL